MTSTLDILYTRGRHQLTEHCHAWLVPASTWGWSNAGLVTGTDQALLVDTLFDLAMTHERGRIAQNVLAVYYELDPTLERVDTREVFRRIAELEGFTE